ncbi:MAG: MBL fold metallo-hydrolase [Streptosporangiaceae bacterium]
MCDAPADPSPVVTAVPRPATGSAVDPIALEPVDEIVITTLVDNVYDGLLASDERATRAPLSAGLGEAPQFETGLTGVGLLAEHGFSALVSVRRATTTTTLLFDTGISPDALVTNAGRLGADLFQIQAVVLSHGHFDHTGGLTGLAGKRGTRSLPMVVHPKVWTRRRLAVPGRVGPAVTSSVVEENPSGVPMRLTLPRSRQPCTAQNQSPGRRLSQRAAARKPPSPGSGARRPGASAGNG